MVACSSIHSRSTFQPATSAVISLSASVDAISWCATSPARWRKTSSLLEKYW